MLNKVQSQRISLEKTEAESCLDILKKPFDERNTNETVKLLQTFQKFEFFRNMPYKFVEIKEQEINLIIEKCIKYMKVISFNPQEMLLERGKKIDCMYLVMRGKIGLFVPKTPQEIELELENWRKMQQISLKEGNNSVDAHKVQINNHKIKLDTLKKIKVHKLGSLAKENLNKFHIKAEIYKIKEKQEVLPGYHLFESAITASQISEYTVFAKECSDLVSISLSDYHQAIAELRTMYKNRYKLLQKSFLTADEVPLNKISMYFFEHKYSCNEIVFNEGDKSDNLYCIASGEIHLLQDRKKRDTVARSASYLYGYTNLIDTILLGDFFGDEWFFEEKERRYTAVAKSEGAVVLSLDSALLARLSSHHPDMFQRLRKLLELKRDNRRKKVDPLDKKRARDYYVNLADFKNIISKHASSPVLTTKIENFKTPHLKHIANIQATPDTSPKVSNLIIGEQKMNQNVEQLKLPLTTLTTPKASPRGSPMNIQFVDKEMAPSSKFAKPAFQFKIPPGTIQKFHVRKSSLQTETLKQLKKQNPFEFNENLGLSPMNSIATKNGCITPSNGKISVKKGQVSKQKDNIFLTFGDYQMEVPQNEKLDLIANRRKSSSVKEQIDSLKMISSKIGELSSTIRTQIHFMDALHGNDSKAHQPFHKHTKSAQIRITLPNFWAEDNNND